MKTEHVMSGIPEEQIRPRYYSAVEVLDARAQRIVYYFVFYAAWQLPFRLCWLLSS
jgi:hypothetical protein